MKRFIDYAAWRDGLLCACVMFGVSTIAWSQDKHFSNLNGGSFNNANHWSPLGAPQPSDHCHIGSLADIKNLNLFLLSDTTVANLTITNGNQLSNSPLIQPNYYKLNVTGTTTIAGKNSVGVLDYPSELVIFSTFSPGNVPDFTTSHLHISNGGLLTMDRAIVDIYQSANLVDGRIWGSGAINLYSNAPVAMSCDGSIVVGTRGLTINQWGAGRIDLGGMHAFDPKIHVNQYDAAGTQFATFTINGSSLHQAYGGEFSIREGCVVNMNLTQGWSMTEGSVIRFIKNQDFDIHGEVQGSQLSFNGSIIFDQAGVKGRINAPISFLSEATTNIKSHGHLEVNGLTMIKGGEFMVGTHGVLDFNGPTQVKGGTFFTHGNPSTKGVVHFNHDTEWDGVVDLKGQGGIETYARQQGHAKVVGATVINAGKFDFDGHWGSSWTINAPLTVNANSLGAYTDLNPNQVFGNITVNGWNIVEQVHLEMNLPQGDSWTMHGKLTLNGSSFSVASTTLRGSDVTLTGNVVVSGNNASTARIHGEGAVFHINSGDTFRLSGGTLASPNTLQGADFIGQGTLAATTNRALVGHGRIYNSISFDGNAELLARGGTLDIHGDVLKAGVVGTADASGKLHFHNPWNTQAAGRVALHGGQLDGVSIINGGRIEGHGIVSPSVLINNGIIEGQGGELILASAQMDLDGTTNLGILRAVDGDLRVAKPYGYFYGTAEVGPGRTLTLDYGWLQVGQLYLVGDPFTPATVAGGGTLFLENLTAVDGKALLRIDTVLNDLANIHLSLGGLSQGYEYDWIEGEFGITLAGDLELELINGFGSTIALGDSFDVITARGGLYGQFHQIIQP
ncbi:MAG TPA: hypothetical protein PKD54_11815, partial [Pirellulaceae bacterium]|nr:hypothetical protein [Pirellulaceae bacterium]